MQLLRRIRENVVSPWMNALARPEVQMWILCGLLFFSVLWKGGKSIDATWILLGVACVIAHRAWCYWRCNTADSPRRSNGGDDVPLVVWMIALAFFAWTTVSYLASTTSNYGLDEVLRDGAFMLLFFWMIRFSKRAERREYQRFLLFFIRTLSIATLIACVIGFFVYVFQPVNRMVGSFFDMRFHTDFWPNAWAEYVLLAWPIFYYWTFRTWRPGPWNGKTIAEFALRALMMGIVFGCLFLSYSRAGILAFLGQIILWAIFSFSARGHTLPWKNIGTVAASFVVVALMTFALANMLRSQYYEVQSALQKATFTAAEGSSSVSERGKFFQQAIVLSAQKPLLGWGPYSFRFVQPRLATSVRATSDHPHNVFLKLAMERGWMASLLFAALLWFVLHRSVRGELARERTVAHHAPFGILLLLSIAGVLAHNLVDYNMQFIGIALPFWMILGMLAGRNSLEDERSVPEKWSVLAERCIATVLILVALIEGMYLVSSSLGRHAEVAGDHPTALRWYSRSSGEYFSRDLHLSSAKLLFEDKRYEEALEALNRYDVQNAQDDRSWRMRADILRAQEKNDEALRAYETAWTFGRYNDIGIALGMVQTLVALEQQETLQQKKESTDALITAYADAIQRNAHFVALSPNVESVIALCNVMAELFPDDAPRYQVIAAKVDHHASIERTRITARQPGFLW